MTSLRFFNSYRSPLFATMDFYASQITASNIVNPTTAWLACKPPMRIVPGKKIINKSYIKKPK